MSTAAWNGELAWTFITPTLTRPTGGDIALFEVANALARRARGHDRVRVVHVPFRGERVRSLGDLPWFGFDAGVTHEFAAGLDPSGLKRPDVVVCTTKLVAAALGPDAGHGGAALLQWVRAADAAGSQVVLYVQGQGVFGPDPEDAALGLPGMKVCVGSSLARLLRSRGVPESALLHIPNGVDPAMFHVRNSISGRPLRAAMCFDPHPMKAGDVGLSALGQQNGLPATVYGTRPPDGALPSHIDFVLSPDRAVIAERILGTSSIYLQPSTREGFGMAAVEAMACGCALVTTANGGSDDYAHDGVTALVCGPSAEEMSEAVGRLARDDALRIQLATAGTRLVAGFRWGAAAKRLEEAVVARSAGLTQ